MSDTCYLGTICLNGHPSDMYLYTSAGLTAETGNMGIFYSRRKESASSMKHFLGPIGQGNTSGAGTDKELAKASHMRHARFFYS